MTSFEKWALWLSTAVVGITGIVYGWMKYLMRTDDPYAVIHHPLQPLVLKAHVLAAPVLVFAVGAVYTRHVVRNWQAGRPRGRWSGASLVAVLVPMIVSGYLIQTLTSESWLFRIAMLHLAAGTVYLAAFAAHQVAGRLRPKSPERPEYDAATGAPPDPDA